jgi:methionyl-tRNA formyltransferase
MFLNRLKGKRLPPSIKEQVAKYHLRYERVPKLSGPECEAILAKEAPDLMASGGTFSIMKENVFGIPRWGTLVSHPGLLPYVRGASSPAWSILKDIEVGCSCLIIDKGIDTGPVIKSRIVPVYYGDTYEDVIERNIIYCGELMAEVLMMFEKQNGPIKGEAQNLDTGETFRVMLPERVEVVKSKLADGTYRWLRHK